MKEQIINKLKLNHEELGTGELLNYLQDVAERTISKTDFNNYLVRANEDQELCEDQDCLVINGDVYDWKEIESEKFEIVKSFLNYFNEISLQKIYEVL